MWAIIVSYTRYIRYFQAVNTVIMKPPLRLRNKTIESVSKPTLPYKATSQRLFKCCDTNLTTYIDLLVDVMNLIPAHKCSFPQSLKDFSKSKTKIGSFFVHRAGFFFRNPPTIYSSSHHIIIGISYSTVPEN